MTGEESNNLPEKKFRAGQITATIWRRKDSQSKANLVVLEKSYKDKESGEWKNTHHFLPSELATVAWLAQQAFEYIVNKEAGRE